MKTKGEFETAKTMYKKALELNDTDDYARHELTKLNMITDPKVNQEVEKLLINLADQKVKVKPGHNASNCDII